MHPPPSIPMKLGLKNHHDGVYARKWPSPVYVLSSLWYIIQIHVHCTMYITSTEKRKTENILLRSEETTPHSTTYIIKIIKYYTERKS